jgi:hypothetical protein
MSKIDRAIGVIDGASDGVGREVGDSVGTSVDGEHVASTSNAAANATLIGLTRGMMRRSASGAAF